MNSSLHTKAIQLALNKDWDKALVTNKRILKRNPGNKKALLRLGKALVQLDRYEEAEEAFKEVLKKDPINKIAKKNLKVIKEKVKV